MPSTFTDYITTITPKLVYGYESTRRGQAVVHSLIDEFATPHVTVRPAGPRSGRMSALFESLSAALTFEAMLSNATMVTFTDASVAPINMVFVVPEGGAIRVTQEEQAPALWSVGFDFTESA